MHFEELAKAITVWVGGLSTAYTLVFFNAFTKGSRGLGAFGTKIVLIAVALAALLFIFRSSKAPWGVVLGALLVAFVGTHVMRTTQGSRFTENEVMELNGKNAQTAAFHADFPFGCNSRCEDD